MFLLYLEPVFRLSCPRAGALSLELAQGFKLCPQTVEPAQVGGSWPDVPAWVLAVVEVPVLPACSPVAAWGAQIILGPPKTQFCPQVPGLKCLRYSPTGWK